jgi:hypothetical protein
VGRRAFCREALLAAGDRTAALAPLADDVNSLQTRRSASTDSKERSSQLDLARPYSTRSGDAAREFGSFCLSSG